MPPPNSTNRGGIYRAADDRRMFFSPIVVRLDPEKPFYKAESYHQDFLVLHPDLPTSR